MRLSIFTTISGEFLRYSCHSGSAASSARRRSRSASDSYPQNDLIKLANFRVKITNKTAEDSRLDLQAARIVISVIEGYGPRLECVTTFFNYHRITSISFRVHPS